MGEEMNPDAEIVIYRDYVIVVGQRIQRPSRISPGQWLSFWEKTKHGLDRVSK